MFCGTGSFKTLEDDHDLCKTPSTPRGNRRKSTSKNNPFSSRGLDKFSTVVSELEARKEKIMAEASSQGVIMVKFMHSQTKDWIPIIIHLPDSKRDTKKDPKRNNNTRSVQSLPVSPRGQVPPCPPANNEIKEDNSRIEEVKNENIMKRRNRDSFLSLSKMRPSTYWPWAMVIVLISLVFFGKTFAICCTSIWWYLIPILNGEDESHERRSTKKDFKRTSSDKKMGNKIGSHLLEPTSPPKGDLVSSKKGKTVRMCSF
ncbi:hypothetical protein LUZ60_007290 [Juncus effusus]|nr:hypothetical protein LUZ60_007290 [Juncus effusus]